MPNKMPDGSLPSEERSMPTDTEMLDWLEQQGRNRKWTVQLESNYPYVPNCVFVSRSSSTGFNTVREALADRMLRERRRENE